MTKAPQIYEVLSSDTLSHQPSQKDQQHKFKKTPEQIGSIGYLVHSVEVGQ
jgi:hypothetical protein